MYRFNIPWTHPTPKRLRDFVVDQMMHADPAMRPTPEQVALEFRCMRECLDKWVDPAGYFIPPHTLETLTPVVGHVPASLFGAAGTR